MSQVIIAAVSVNRSDIGRMTPLYEALSSADWCEFCLLAIGEQALPVGVSQVSRHELEGEMTASEVASAVLVTTGQFLRDHAPDFLIILGDRFEMLAVGQAALLNSVKILHVGGGYVTKGAFDDQCRNALTQLSSHHFTASSDCTEKVTQMLGCGKLVYEVGAPDIDALKTIEISPHFDLMENLGLVAEKPFVLVTLHPETLLAIDQQSSFYEIFFSFLESLDVQILITSPCPDPGAEMIDEMILKLREGDDVVHVSHLGMERYVSAMHHAQAMIGNSSSGMIEASAMGLPVVNIGSRQEGRLLTENVRSCGFNFQELSDAYQEVISEEFLENLSGLESPYGKGDSCEKMLAIIRKISGATDTKLKS